MDESEAVGAAVFELERFEWARPDRIEVVGTWSSVRGRRFMRPTLVLEREGESIRLLAALEHKPWIAQDGESWIAAFAWDGDPVRFKSADLNVASGIDVKLPPPRMRPGKPRRFQRVVSRDASRESEATVRGPGIVTEPIRALGADGAPAAASSSTTDSPATGSVPSTAADEAATAAEAPASTPADEAATAAEAPAADEAAPAVTPKRKRASKFEAASAPDPRLATLTRERDDALEQVRALRAEIEAERQSRGEAMREARAQERSATTGALAQGAELRAAVERQRAAAYEARDAAITERDAAIGERDDAVRVGAEAVRAQRVAERERRTAEAERDRARTRAERAEAARAQAEAERDAAVKERETIVSVHERGLPVVPPKPRFLPDGRPKDLQLMWAARAAAIGFLAVVVFIVLHLLAG